MCLHGNNALSSYRQSEIAPVRRDANGSGKQSELWEMLVLLVGSETVEPIKLSFLSFIEVDMDNGEKETVVS